ncbi:MAG: ATP-binding cassette domain-containing protein [Thermoplasmata archaeon]|nr:ATP-binding cassette domain-containing protein [Thermoplasmata archaeon]
MTGPLLETRNVTKHFPLSRSLTQFFGGEARLAIHAVDGVSVQVAAGETLGLIGESGSGKTTLGWLMARLHSATSGEVLFEGQDVSQLSGAPLRRWRQNLQVVFQDPVGSLDPRQRVWQIVSEPIQAQHNFSKAKLRTLVAELLPTVGLPPDCLDQYPHEFSGGGRQRLSLARALSLKPKLVVLDEPTSALDVAVQAQILNRLVSLQREFGFSYVLITHNVAAVRFVADRVAVMYLGKVAEVGPVRDVLEHPVHPYTKALLAAVPVADTRRRRTRYKISGEVPTLIRPPPGCRFAARCPFVIDRCRVEEPLLLPLVGASNHVVACHRAAEVADVAPESLLVTVPPPTTAAA